MAGKLFLLSGVSVEPDPPFVIPADKRAVCGRGTTADLVVLDRECSREHFAIEVRDGEAFLEDLGSSNGTYVNDVPAAEPVLLADGDVIRAGAAVFHFSTNDEDTQESVLAAYAAKQPGAGSSIIEPAEGGASVVRVSPTPVAGQPHAHHDHTVRLFLEKHPNDTANKVFTKFQIMWYTLVLLGLFVLFNYHPLHFLHVFHAFCVIYLLVILYKLAAVFLSVVRPGEIHVTPAEIAALKDEDLPVYTILVPLYKETEVAGKVIRNISAFDYPQHKLDVKILLEPDDEGTLNVCRAARLPSNYEIIVVPEGIPKTKPKACNHGLERAKGEYLVIYDGEDRPEPDQLKKAVVAFNRLNAPKKGLGKLFKGSETVCLQAKLNYFNPRQNLLTRWFTIEYSTWFDLFLPGLHRLGCPIPLGGTSNHFKTKVLQHIGGWDPFNVTEDCDLGIRLHKMGFNTHVLDSTTWEEANSQVWNWVRQRSRWVKGYIQTHLVHMRNPIATLWRLGPVGLFGFLASVGGLSLMLLLNPIFWAIVLFYGVCWVHDLSIANWDMAATLKLQADYVAGAWPWDRWLNVDGPWVWQMWFNDPRGNPFWNTWSQVFYIITCVLFLGNFLFVLMHVWACIRRKIYGLIPHALLTPFYWVLISLGAWKGFLQLFFNPFKWEKTHHGLDAGGKGQ